MTVAGLAIERAGLIDKLHRVPKSDTFARMLIMGKIKAVQRTLDAMKPTPPDPS